MRTVALLAVFMMFFGLSVAYGSDWTDHWDPYGAGPVYPAFTSGAAHDFSSGNALYQSTFLQIPPEERPLGEDVLSTPTNIYTPGGGNSVFYSPPASTSNLNITGFPFSWAVGQ